MKRILGLDLGTASIGWALTNQDFDNKKGNIEGIGSRIIPMSQDVMDNFGKGQSISQTAERTDYRGTRRLYQRDNLRRERLHRVLNILNFLPKHYAENIDFEKHFGQFKKETKLNYKQLENGKFEFLFSDSFNEMVADFKTNEQKTKIPYDWTIYYLRKKALSKKITKEELAWILLNFNQKRGYYQLRGEEEEVQEGKMKTFEVLKVTEVKDSGETIKGKGDKLFDIYFENGWKYDKQTTKPEIWLNKTKEYIVTTSTLKDGSTKRTFKEVDSEKDWIAIKKKTEQDIENSEKTVGQYIYETLLNNPTQKIRGKLIKTIERKFYKDELRKIIQKQIALQPELFSKELYQKCVEELYPRNEAHKNNIREKGFEYLFLDDIIFYQRPLKSKKSTISGCQYETRTFFVENKETGKKEKKIQALKVIPKSHPLFIEFRMWQFLRNLKIYHKDDKANIDITANCFQNNEEWCDLYDFLMDKKEVEQKHIIKYLSDKNRIEKTKKEEYRWNFQEDKKLSMNETKAQLISRFKKVENFDLTRLNSEFQTKLWHIIYSVKDKKEFEQALKTFAKKNDIDEKSFVENFKTFPPYKSEYGAYSEKAIKKLLPLMRMGRYWDENKIPEDVKLRISDIKERLNSINYDKKVFEKDKQNRLQNVVDDAVPKQLLKSFINFKDKNHLEGLNTYQACYAVYERHSEVGEIKRWKTSSDIDIFLNEFKQHSLRNPIVEQVLTETLRTVRDIWNYFGEGKEKFFDEIHLELGRDMKNSADKRKTISDKNVEKERTNQRIKELLKELKSDYKEADIRPYSPSHQEILKIYEEGVIQNPNVKYSNVSEEEINKIRKNNSPTKKDIEKYKLWLEQGYISPYTGKIIPLGKLFSEEYQIEHIIPQSRYFDDSLNNKVICESAVNQEKSNKTAYEFLSKRGGDIIELGNGNNVTLLSLEAYEQHCGQYFKKNRTKLNNLLSEDIPEGFINRQMNDSRYISKMVKSLLSNIVREENEREATSKNLLPIPGAVTSKLKHDWGLNDKWNEIIAPRFKRLNEITKKKQIDEFREKLKKKYPNIEINKEQSILLKFEELFDKGWFGNFGYRDNTINAFRIQVPDEISKKGFNKKRIDHRHHALDALVIACTTQDHTHYLHSLESEKENHSLKYKLLIVNDKGHYTKHFQMPWSSFPVDAKNELDKIIVSFKKNLRVINKTNNKTWQWVKQKNGSFKKELVKQTEGDSWAIRKPLHKETVSGLVNIPNLPKGKIATASRISLTDEFTRKQLESITDIGIQKILENHIKNYIDEKGKECFDLAFNSDGVEQLNKNIVTLNNGKKHQPIYKVRVYEVGSKFKVSEDENSPKSTKYVEAAQRTNLFFAVYWDENKKQRSYETIPLNEVIQHQKDVAKLPKNERTPIQPKATMGKFLFTLSPNDLVFVPTEEEQDNPNLVDFDNLSEEQVGRVYKMVSTTQNKLECVPVHYSSPIISNEMGSNNKNQNTIYGIQIKYICWKLEVDRLGNIVRVIK